LSSCPNVRPDPNGENARGAAAGDIRTLFTLQMTD
jgi:hypothetical protein